MANRTLYQVPVGDPAVKIRGPDRWLLDPTGLLAGMYHAPSDAPLLDDITVAPAAVADLLIDDGLFMSTKPQAAGVLGFWRP